MLSSWCLWEQWVKGRAGWCGLTNWRWRWRGADAKTAAQARGRTVGVGGDEQGGGDRPGGEPDRAELLDMGLSQPALFPPGTSWAYSNTNYALAGLLIQAVSDRPVGEEITRRIIEPLQLKDTYWPGVGEQRLRAAHPRGYQLAQNSPPVDVTDQDTSAPWAAGALVSTPSDLLRSFTALLDGRLLTPELLEQMQTTVPAPGSSVSGDEQYGLGLATFTLSCGGVAWTHGGDIPGYETRNAVTTDGRGAVVAVTALPTTLEAAQRVEEAVDTALCA